MFVSVSNVELMERLCQLTNKIYREMLCITSLEKMTYITIRGLGQARSSAFSWTPEYTTELSWHLLTWISVKGRIPCSFTRFITTSELSGPLYISTDIYHTEIRTFYGENLSVSSFLSA